MKVAILGGGFTGLSAAFYLSKKKYNITIFEKETVLGGLAAGFRGAGWEWSLERAYHHWFTNDHDVLDFAEEVGFEEIVFRTPVTASLYDIGENIYRTFPVNSPQDFLKLPLLNLPEKLRAGAVLAFLKVSPFFSVYEKQTAVKFLKTTMGERAWLVLWEELFRKKFGKYAGKILASFIWSRIKKRTPNLGYPAGGYQKFIEHLEGNLLRLGVEVRKGVVVESVTKRGEIFKIGKDSFDVVISTLPTPVLPHITKDLLPSNYLEKTRKIKYLHALTLILETEIPVFEKEYWVNVCAKDLPFMALVQHTNYIEKKYYNNHHLLYLGWYLERDDKLMSMDKEQLLSFVRPYLKILNSQYSILNSYHFRGPFAQPIFDSEFLKNKPDFVTPVKNFFIANLDMTYPHDRGTNYAVKLGREVAGMV